MRIVTVILNFVTSNPQESFVSGTILLPLGLQSQGQMLKFNQQKLIKIFDI